MKRKLKYDSQYLPPAPVVTIQLTTQETNLSTAQLAALIDTGADVSFAPLDVLESIQAGIGKVHLARTLWGERQTFSSYIVDIQMNGLVLPGMVVLGYDGDEVILGRDILNKLWLELDGPAQTVEVAEKRPRRK
jgi:predicted aspartyl protease